MNAPRPGHVAEGRDEGPDDGRAQGEHTGERDEDAGAHDIGESAGHDDDREPTEVEQGDPCAEDSRAKRRGGRLLGDREIRHKEHDGGHADQHEQHHHRGE